MIPTDSSGDFPDITFRFTPRYYHERHKEFDSLVTGDIVRFKGEFSHIGDEFSFHFLELLDFNKTSQHVDMEKIPVFELKDLKAIGNLRKENKDNNN